MFVLMKTTWTAANLHREDQIHQDLGAGEVPMGKEKMQHLRSGGGENLDFPCFGHDGQTEREERGEYGDDGDSPAHVVDQV